MKRSLWLLEGLGVAVLYLLHPLAQPAPRDGWWMACLVRDVGRFGWPPVDHQTVLEGIPRLLYGWVYGLWSFVALHLGGAWGWELMEAAVWVGFWGVLLHHAHRRGTPAAQRALAVVLGVVYIGPYVWFRPLSFALILYAGVDAWLRENPQHISRLPLLGWLWMQIHPSAWLLVPMVWTHPRLRRRTVRWGILGVLLLHPQLGMLVRTLWGAVHGVHGYAEWASPLRQVTPQGGVGLWVLLPFGLSALLWFRISSRWARGWLGFWTLAALATTRAYPFLVITLVVELLVLRIPFPHRVETGIKFLPLALGFGFLLLRSTAVPLMPDADLYRTLPRGVGWTRQDWANPVCWYRPQARVWLNGMDVPTEMPEAQRLWTVYFRILKGDPRPLEQANVRWVLTGPGMDALERALPREGWIRLREQGPYRLWVAQGSR